MRAGLLRFPISILEKQETKDEYGATSTNWVEFQKTKANVVNLSGKKGVSDEQINNTRITDFTIRHNIKVDEKMRIIYDGNLYKINFINKFILYNYQIIGTEYIEKV